MSFRENLRDELNYKDVRIKELSEKTNISIGTINHYLAEKSTVPTVENAVKIAQALNVTVEYLVTGKNPSSKNSESQLTNEEIRLYKQNASIILKLANLSSDTKKIIENLLDHMK